MSHNKRKNRNVLFPELTISLEQEKKVQKMLEEVKQVAPYFWEEGITDSFYLPVDDGEIRIFHWKPEHPVSVRPIVFVPGWGVMPVGYYDYFQILYNRVECYYLETREKASSRIDKKKANLDLHQKAKDVADVLGQLDLVRGSDYILMAPCWGAAILLQGLLDGTIKAPTIVTVDPMHTLWFPKWLLRYIAPWIPLFLIDLIIKPLFKRILLGDMKEPTQKMRAETFVDNAITWKWRKAAVQVRDFELYKTASDIRKEIFILNGTSDKVHEQSDYPRLARLIPKARFIYMKTTEDNRERLMGLVALEFSKVTFDVGIPPVLREFEKEIHRAIT